MADSAEQIGRIVATTEGISGVRAVRSLVRQPGEPPPHEMAVYPGQPGDDFVPSNPGL